MLDIKVCGVGRLVHTMCSTQWPHELNFWIFPNSLVDVIQIMFGTFWWSWFAKESWFEKIQMWHDLKSISLFHLCLIIVSNRKGTSQSGQHQKCSTWWGLGWGAKSWESLVKKNLNTGAQSGYPDVNGTHDHYHMWEVFDFSFDLFCIYLIQKFLFWV